VTSSRRPLSADNYARFQIGDASNDLYWNGKRVRLGGWSVTEKLTAAGIIIAAIVGLVTNWPNLNAFWDHLSRKPAPPAVSKESPAPPQQAAPPASPQG
jgi:hypothetical protein